jgi:iron complex transport system substrate-binding protein
MKRYHSPFTIILVFLFCIPLAAQPKTERQPQAPATYTDSRGTVYPLSAVHRLVSLGPTVTETICALGGEDMLVGRTDYCNYPASVADIPSIGGILNPSVEKIIRLKPDLVIASSMVSDDVYRALEKAGVKAISINKEGTFEGTFGFIRDVGLVIGKKQEAENLAASMHAQLAAIQERYKNKPNRRVCFVVAFGTYDASATGDTYLDEMITLAGGINVAKDGRNWMFSKEQLLLANPDVIILMGRMNDGKSDAQLLAEWNDTKPYCDMKAEVKIIDGDLIGRQGPRTVQGIGELARLIHGE